MLLLFLYVFTPSFFQAQFRHVGQRAPVLVAAVGMAAILARHIDISIGSQFSVCGVVAVWRQSRLPHARGRGDDDGCRRIIRHAVNGVLAAGLGLPSIVVTLATMVILRESLRHGRTREGEAVRNLPPDFQWFGASQNTGQWIVLAIALAVFVVVAWSMLYVVARAVYAVGSDPEAARLAGIRPRRVVFCVFVLMGLLTGLASLLHSTRFAIVDPNMSSGLNWR